MIKEEEKLNPIDVVRKYLNNNFTWNGTILSFKFPSEASLNLFSNTFEKIKYNVNKDTNEITLEGSNIIDFLGILYKDDFSLDNLYKILYTLTDIPSLPKLIWFKNDENAIEPSKSRYSDAGYDLTIIKKISDISENISMYDTGISLQIPIGYRVSIYPRSSLSKSGYILSNLTGIIDVGYTGNLFICLTRVDKSILELKLPFKCCQLVLEKCEYSHLIQGINKNILVTSRNDKGFGSTDKKE